MPPKKAKKSKKTNKKSSKGKGVPSDSAIKVTLAIPDHLLEFSEKVKSVLNLPKPHLSPSSIGTYQRCAYQFMENYVNGNRGGSSVPMVEGTTHHSTFEFNNRYKRKTSKDRPVKKLIEHFCDNFHDNWKEIDNKKGFTEREVIIRGRKIQTRYSQTFAPRFTPALIEQEFHLMIGPVKILCYMDASGTLRPAFGKGPSKEVVCDYKVASRLKSEKEVKNSIQLTTYGVCDAFARKLKKPADVGFCTCVKSHSPMIDWQHSTMNEHRIEWLIKTVLTVAYAISVGAFPVCDPSENGLCSQKWCGCWDKCLGEKYK